MTPRREKLFYSLYYDDIDKVKITMKNYLNGGFISNDDFDAYTENYTKGIYAEVKQYCELNSCKDFPTPTKIAKWALQNRDNDGWVNEMISAYDIWSFYSKYEHVGWHSYAFTRNSKVSHRKDQEWILPILSKALVTAASATLQLGDANSSDSLMKLVGRISEGLSPTRE